MAEFKKIVLTEKDNSISSYDSTLNDQQSTSDIAADFDSSYTNTKLNELFNEYSSISIDENLIGAASEIKQQSSISVKQKIVLSTISIIAVLCAFLAIYNIFVIKSMSAGIGILQDNITTQEFQMSEINNNLNAILNEDSIKEQLIEAGYSELASDQIISYAMTNADKVFGGIECSTNWFDGVCNFISNVFGG